jgi:hypothetical protein
MGQEYSQGALIRFCLLRNGSQGHERLEQSTQVPHQQALGAENQTGSENRPSQVKSILMEKKVKTMKKTIQTQDSN